MDVELDLDILTGKKCHQFKLRTWPSLICQFVHPVGEDWIKGID